MNPVILLDGAMGTMLQAAGLPAGGLPETWNILHPEVVVGIQKQYVDAGSNIIFANTFGANRLKTAGCGYTVRELVSAGIACARKAAEGTDTKVALDIGPIGQMLRPLGMLSFDEAYDIFREMVEAGEEAGADMVIFETMGDLREIKAGILAAREHSALPIWATMTFEKSRRTFVGVSIPAMALTLGSLGVEAMGFNCSLGPKELLPMAEELMKWTDKPVILKPNAGLPDSVTGRYSITPEEFSEEVLKGLSLGIGIFGGCCGTSPDFIAALKKKAAAPAPRKAATMTGVCSASQVIDPEESPEIGHSMAGGSEDYREAVEDEDFDSMADLCMEDMDEDAEVIHIHLEGDIFPRAVEEIQAVVNLPMLLSSEDTEALEQAIRAYNGRPLVLVRDEETRALCEKYGAEPMEA